MLTTMGNKCSKQTAGIISQKNSDVNEKKIKLITGYVRIYSNNMNIIAEIIQIIFDFQQLIQSLYIFGSNTDKYGKNDGRLGLGNDKNRCPVPQKIDSLDDNILQVSCKRFHTIIITDMTSNVYVCGKNHNGIYLYIYNVYTTNYISTLSRPIRIR